MDGDSHLGNCIQKTTEISGLSGKGQYVFVVFYSLAFLISIQYQYGIFANLDIPAYIVSAVGWVTLLFAFTLLSRNFYREVLVVFIAFSLVGFALGPFLEPPSDPMEHLRRIYAACDASTGNWLPRQLQGEVSNSIGLWHYSMSSSILCCDVFDNSPEKMLFRIHLLHGVLLGVLISAIYILGKRAGLISRWAFFGCLTAFFFMGTNSFSYFRYYSFSPGYTSLLLCWLWTAGFFFENRVSRSLLGSVVALTGGFILWTNHYQETVFLCLIFFFGLIVNMYFWLEGLSKYLAGVPGKYCKDQGQIRKSLRWVLTVSLVLVFFILPQVEIFRNWISVYFIKNLWSDNNELVFFYNQFIVFSKFWGFRADETFTWVAAVIGLLSVAYYHPGTIEVSLEVKNKIVVLSLLPLFVYLLPLATFMWVSHVQVSEFYRVCYVSMFWLFFASLFQGIEGYIKRRFQSVSYAGQ